jgi:hypothetical protein
MARSSAGAGGALQWKIGDHIPLTSPIWGEPENQPNWDFEIVGDLEGAKKGTDTSGHVFPLRLLRRGANARQRADRLGRRARA